MAEAIPGAGDDEIEDAQEQNGPDYQDLLLRAGFNYHVFIAAAFGFLRGRGSGPDEFVSWTAERLAPTWAGLQGHGADAVLTVLLQNLASTGYPVHDVDFGADESRAEVGAIPLGLEAEQWQQVLEPFGVTPEEMRALFRVFDPLVRSAGATLDLAGLRDRLRITVRRQAPPAAESPAHDH